MNWALILFHYVNHEIMFDITEKIYAVDKLRIWTALTFHFVSQHFHCFYSIAG